MTNEQTRSAALDAKLDRMLELIQQEFVASRNELRAEINEFRAETNRRFAEVDERFDALRVEMAERFDASRVEMAERFQSVMDRLDLLERQVARNTATVQEMRGELDGLRSDMLKLQEQMDRTQKSINGLSDDMRQRFRVMNERLAAS